MGARVLGVEGDPELADEARRRLRRSGIRGDVLTADLLADPLPAADVYFAYLAPATLQRLVPALSSSEGRALVTVDFAVPGVKLASRSGPVLVYDLPLPDADPPLHAGWPSAGSLIAAVPDHQSLHCLSLDHPGGRTSLRLTRGLAPLVRAMGGADQLEAPSVLAVDLRCEEAPAGTVSKGSLRVAGLRPSHPVFVVYDEADTGTWELTDDGVAGISRALRRRSPPRTLAGFLAAAES